MRVRDGPKIILLLILLLIFSTGLPKPLFEVKAATGVPKIIHYQGRLLDSSGNLLGGSGTDYCFKFSIYDNSSVDLGTKLWPAGAPSTMTVSVKNGVFNVGIGDTAAGGDTLDYNFQDNNTIYLNVEVATKVGGTCAAGDGAEVFQTLGPRQQILSSGYSINASTVGGFTPSQYASSTQIPVLNSGNLSLGGTNPQINATGTNSLTLQGGGGTGDIQFFSSANKITSAGALTVAGAITSNGLTINSASTTGGIFFANSSGALAQSSTALYWDNVNGRLGIGTNSPSSTLDVRGNIVLSSGADLRPLTNSTNALRIAEANAGRPFVFFDSTNGRTGIGFGAISPSSTLHVSGTALFKPGSDQASAFEIQPSSSTTPIFSIDSINARVGIGTATPTTTLDVIGSTVSAPVAGAVTVGGAQLGMTLTKNDANTATVIGVLVKPTLNTGASNNNTTFTALKVDSQTTATTGITTQNIVDFATGGSSRLVVNSTGNIVQTSAAAGTTAYQLGLSGFTSGKGLQVFSSSNSITSGNLLDVGTTGTAGSLAFTGNVAKLSDVRTYTSGVGLNSTGNVLNVSRAITLNNAGNTHTISGAVVTISDTATQTAGTLTSTADVVDIVQNYTSNSGVALNVSTAGTGFALRVNDDGTFTDATPFVIDTTGNVGIQNTAPSTTLDITGSLGVAGSSTFVGPLSLSSQRTLTANAATPSVSAGSHFTTANTAATTITNFTSGITGQLLTLKVGDNNTTFKCTAATSLDCGTTDIATVASDTLTFVYDGTKWNLISWMKSNAAQTGADIAELFPSQEELEPGDVVAVDTGNPVHVIKSTTPYSRKTIGIVATKPGIVLGEITDEKTYPVALAGRVPVKVTAENGPISIGDFITASPIPGVGMKATKAGQVIGQALSSFEGSGMSTITVFVNVSYFSGPSLSSLFPGLTDVGNYSNALPIDLSRQILTGLSQGNQPPTAIADLSAMVADRVVAGIEIITPRLVTNTLAAGSIEPLSENLALNLNQSGKFVIRSLSSTEAVISFDSSGNAFFAGQVKADSISANKISGLEVITSKISLLSSEVEGLTAAQDASSTVKGYLEVQGGASFLGEVKALKIIAENIESPSLASLKEAVALLASTTEELKSETASSTQAISGLTSDLLSLGQRITLLENQNKVSFGSNSGSDKGLEINGLSLMRGGLKVEKISALDNEITFLNDVVFFGRPYFTTDTAGFAIIKAGQNKVEVVFERDYIEKPVVNITVSLDQSIDPKIEEMILSGDLRYIGTRVSTKGFTILLNKAASVDIQFSWTALAVKGAKTFTSLPQDNSALTPAPTPPANPSDSSANSTTTVPALSGEEPKSNATSTESASSIEGSASQQDSSSSLSQQSQATPETTSGTSATATSVDASTTSQ